MNRYQNASRRCHKKPSYFRWLWSKSVQANLTRLSSRRRVSRDLSRFHRCIRGAIARRGRWTTEDGDADLLEVLRLAMSAVDPNTALHCDRVASYLAWLANAVCQDLSEEELHLLWESGWLHDVGKISLSPTLLTSSKRLTKDEITDVRTHPQRGAALVSQMPRLRHAVPVVLHHHERYDGDGYPMGLVGEAIPLFARIACVVDAFDAMTGYRPYRTRASLEVAMQEIIANSGSQFDPLIVNIFVREFHHVRHLYHQLHSANPPTNRNAPNLDLVNNLAVTAAK